MGGEDTAPATGEPVTVDTDATAPATTEPAPTDPTVADDVPGDETVAPATREPATSPDPAVESPRDTARSGGEVVQLSRRDLDALIARSAGGGMQVVPAEDDREPAPENEQRDALLALLVERTSFNDEAEQGYARSLLVGESKEIQERGAVRPWPREDDDEDVAV